MMYLLIQSHQGGDFGGATPVEGGPAQAQAVVRSCVFYYGEGRDSSLLLISTLGHSVLLNPRDTLQYRCARFFSSSLFLPLALQLSTLAVRPIARARE